MKHLLLTTIAGVVLVGCGPKAPDISIHEAAELGNIEAVKQHLDFGTDVNAPALDLIKKRRKYNGNSPLFFASTEEVAEMLIENGAKIQITFNGFNPLHWAADRGHKEVVELLTKKGMNINSRAAFRGMTPLHFSVHEGRINVTELLIKMEANINAQDIDGFTPLDYTKLPSDEDDNIFELEPELLAQNTKVIADLLRKHGGKTSEELKAEGKSLIHEAVMKADIPGIEVELNKGVNIDLPISPEDAQEGFTPLALAIIEFHFEVVEFLIANGADVNAPIRSGEAEGYTPLFFAAPVSDKKYVELLIEKGADVNALIPFGHAKSWTPLLAATQEGRTEIAKLLIDNGADVDLKVKNNFTALAFAAEHGQVAIGSLLLSEGANINARGDKNVTPLIMGTAKNQIEMVKFLISKGADLNAKTSKGNTALDTAKGLKNLEVVKLLQSHGGKSGKLSLIQIVIKNFSLPIVSCICFLAYWYRRKRMKHGGKTGEELKAEGK